MRIQFPCIQGIKFLLYDALALNKFVHLIVGHRLGKLLVNRIIFIQRSDNFLDTLLDNFANGFCAVKYRFLFKIPDGMSG